MPLLIPVSISSSLFMYCSAKPLSQLEEDYCFVPGLCSFNVQVVAFFIFFLFFLEKSKWFKESFEQMHCKNLEWVIGPYERYSYAFNCSFKRKSWEWSLKCGSHSPSNTWSAGIWRITGIWGASWIIVLLQGFSSRRVDDPERKRPTVSLPLFVFFTELLTLFLHRDFSICI